MNFKVPKLLAPDRHPEKVEITNRHPERMEITQPRVARNELPWGKASHTHYPERVASAPHAPHACIVKMSSTSHESHPLSRPGLRSERAFSLFEFMIAAAIASLVLSMIMMLYLFGLRSFGAMSNYAQMSSHSRRALDVMARDIRQATIVLSYNPNLPVKQLQLATYDFNGPCTVTYSWDSNARVLTSTKVDNAGQSTTVTNLTGCDSWTFNLFQRTPTNAYTFYPTTDLKLCKLINMSWKCSRTILGKKVNTEDVMTAEVVLRNMNIIISN